LPKTVRLIVEFTCSVEQEIALFEAMMGHKPVGISKNIHMMCIHRKLTTKWINNDNKNAAITPGHIWAKLESMFDLEALDNSECVPFPDDKR
jgi:MRG-binding protein